MKEIMGWQGRKAIDCCGRNHEMERTEIKDNYERNHTIKEEEKSKIIMKKIMGWKGEITEL